ncbi:hypothetical protein [Sunxiuqinia dokdonensis]|uniref:hypothetical protein n=1 Tax=Sunxiuqinia dokdonensis TaxID=1409788 RepID=UPI0012F73C8C|nr:hypothetical protein [Sunxiuqinia dokdonensis]
MELGYKSASCPSFAHQKKEDPKPTAACQFFYEFSNYQTVLERSNKGDRSLLCFCSSIKCPFVHKANLLLKITTSGQVFIKIVLNEAS